MDGEKLKERGSGKRGMDRRTEELEGTVSERKGRERGKGAFDCRCGSCVSFDNPEPHQHNNKGYL